MSIEADTPMRLKRIVTKRSQENVYIYYNEESRQGIVIDPGGEAEEIISFIQENQLTISYILLTHGHFDHIMAVEDVKKATNAPVVANVLERNLLGDPSLNLSLKFHTPCSVKVDKALSEGDILSLGGVSLRAISTPGHTAGGMCFYVEEEGVLFSGDTLFHESVGRVDLPTSDGLALEKSLTKLFALIPDDTRVYPGHSRPTSIGHERVNNPYFTTNKSS